MKAREHRFEKSITKQNPCSTMTHHTRGFAAYLGQIGAFINHNSNPTRWSANTYVKSCKMTLAGLKGISVLVCEFCSQARMFSTSCPLTEYSSQFLTADSKRTLIEYGRVSTAEKKKVNKVRAFWKSLPTESCISKSWELVELMRAKCGLDLVKLVGPSAWGEGASGGHNRELVFPWVVSSNFWNDESLHVYKLLGFIFLFIKVEYLLL